MRRRGRRRREIAEKNENPLAFRETIKRKTRNVEIMFLNDLFDEK